MEDLEIAFLIMLMAAGRLHGIGNILGGRVVSMLIVGICFGLAGMIFWGTLWALLGGIISGAALAIGHGNFYDTTQGAQDGIGNTPSTPESIEIYFARPIWLFFKGDIHSPLYSWWCMGLKWLVVGICVPPVAGALFLFAPAAYAVSFSFTKSSALAEWITTIFTSLLLTYVMLPH